jgi:hypothetical protein
MQKRDVVPGRFGCGHDRFSAAADLISISNPVSNFKSQT